MATSKPPVLSGGCQCGAVRYALYATPTGTSLCWCRMCQKAFGGYFAALTGVPRADFAWTRGEAGAFRSSEAVERDFCRDCGTPLTYRVLSADRISVAAGSLDQPYAVTPRKQFGIENRAPFADALPHLEAVPTSGWMKPEDAARFKSRQHPDHD